MSSKQNPSHENRTPVKKTWAYVRIRLTASRTILEVELFQYFLSPVRFSSRNYGQDQHCRWKLSGTNREDLNRGGIWGNHTIDEGGKLGDYKSGFRGEQQPYLDREA